jgi:hypothetical protein
VIDVEPGRADDADVTVDVRPRRFRIRPGTDKMIAVSAHVPLLPRAPGVLNGILRARIEGGATLRVPWSIAVPLNGKPLLARVKISDASFAPSDTNPSVLTLVAGRVDGTPERPQLLPLEQLEVRLRRGRERIGLLTRIRDVLPGRYAFGITGRGPDGRRLRAGNYELRVIATPVGGGGVDERTIPFAIE